MFCQQKRLQGLAFAEIARMWKKKKYEESFQKAYAADAKKRPG
jgi:hypothetical protein